MGMIGIGISPALASLMGAAAAPVTPETLIPAAKGTWAFQTNGDLGFATPGTITVAAGDVLVVAVGYDNPGLGALSLDSLTFGQLPMTREQLQGADDGDAGLEVWRIYCASETTGLLAGSWPGSQDPPLTILLMATAIAGAANAAADKKPSAAAVGSTATSGSTGTLTQAHEIALGYVLGLCGPTGNPDNWSGIWVSGQRVTVSGGNTDMVLSEGRAVRTTDDAIEAAKALGSSMSHIAICATFRAAA